MAQIALPSPSVRPRSSHPRTHRVPFLYQRGNIYYFRYCLERPMYAQFRESFPVQGKAASALDQLYDGVEGDNHLIELAVAGNARAIVTHNVKDLRRGQLSWPHLRIVTPVECLEELP